MSSRFSDREEGFTLIELLIAMVVSGLILSALTTGFIVAMKGTAGAHDRFVASNGAQTLATYFTSDVQSANPSTVSTAAEDTGCSSTAPASTTNVLRLQWTEMTTATEMSAFSVSYRTRQVGSDWQLVRYACSNAKDPFTTATDILSAEAPADHVLVHDLYESSPTSPYPTTATIEGRKITLSAFAALGEGETTPYSYSLSSNMRTKLLTPSVDSITRADPDPTNDINVSWTIKFSETVTGVDELDFSLAPSGSIVGASISLFAASADGKTYTVTASSGTGSGTLGLNLIDNDTIADADGNNLEGDFTGQFYTVDKGSPTVTVNKKTDAPAQADPTNALPIVFTAIFGEVVTGFDGSDVTLTGCAPDVPTATVTGSGTNYSISVTGLTADCTVTAVIPAGRATDPAGNTNVVSTSTGNNNRVTFNAPPTPPMVTSIVRVGPTPTVAASLSWTATFNKPVTGVDADDFELEASAGISGQSITNVVSTDGGTTWTITASRGTGYGTLGLNLDDDDSIQSGSLPLAGPTRPDGGKDGEVYTISAISSIELLNATGGGKTAGQMEKDDQIVVTFSTPMDASSICSAWTGTGNKGPTNALVTVNDGATDSISVTSAACPTFRFGTITLESGSYVTGGNVTFGASGNASEISWDSAGRKLTIKFGNKSSGPGSGSVGTVDSSTATYTPDANIKDSTGTSIGNTPASKTGKLF
jgi:prepilin-type N-terminal cleavage/methylation domain-containing protein